jgi:outer membrane receptor protein involved in Fe transport
VPVPWQSLLVIVGAEGRSSWASSPQLLDAETFSDISHPDYRKPGLANWELRTGAFVHVEYTPADWVTVTGGLRLDYNTESGEFLSPRLAAVFNPLGDQFIRLGIARAFRKPSLWEARLHPGVLFPEGGVEANLVDHPQWMVDLEESSFAFQNSAEDFNIVGGELALRYKFNRQVQLMASWTSRVVFEEPDNLQVHYSPKNMFTLGGRFLAEWDCWEASSYTPGANSPTPR